MHGPGGRKGMNSSEKAKDFKKSMLNLINYSTPNLIFKTKTKGIFNYYNFL